jgi:hypothetical protein
MASASVAQTHPSFSTPTPTPTPTPTIKPVPDLKPDFTIRFYGPATSEGRVVVHSGPFFNFSETVKTAERTVRLCSLAGLDLLYTVHDSLGLISVNELPPLLRDCVRILLDTECVGGESGESEMEMERRLR